jgi:hypothetical protein
MNGISIIGDRPTIKANHVISLEDRMLYLQVDTVEANQKIRIWFP